MRLATSTMPRALRPLALLIAPLAPLASLAMGAAWGCSALVGADFSDPSVAPRELDTTTCTLPTGGDARVRIADLAPMDGRFDFCLAPSDATSAPTKGVLASSGKSCPAGLAYEEVLAPFAVAAGSYRVSAVPAGAPCASPVGAGSFTVGGGETVTLLFAGDPAHPTLAALPESAADGASAASV